MESHLIEPEGTEQIEVKCKGCNGKGYVIAGHKHGTQTLPKFVRHQTCRGSGSTMQDADEYYQSTRDHWSDLANDDF